MANETTLDRFSDLNQALRSGSLVPAWGEGQNEFFTRGSLINENGDRHLARRRLYGHLFSGERLRFFRDTVFLPAVRQYFDSSPRQDRHGKSLISLDLVMLSRLSFTQVGIALVGLEGNVATDLETLVADLVAVSGGNNIKSAQPRSADQTLEEARRAKDEFADKWFQPSLSRWEQQNRDGSQSDALIPMMLAHRDLYEPDVYEAMLNESLLFLTALTNSTSRILPHIVIELCNWPSSRGSDPEQDTAVLRRAFFEAHRLHPRGPPRRYASTDDLLLSNDVTIPKEWQVNLDTSSAGRDESAFGADSDQFDPNRNLDAPLDRLVFGGGPHACIGKALSIGTGAESGIARGTDPGLLMALLDELLRAEIMLDPDQPPVPDQSTQEDNYSSVPVLLAG